VNRGAWAVALAAAVLGVGAGVAWDRLWRRDAIPRTDASAPPLAWQAELSAITDEVAALRDALDEERSLRGAIELELALLRRRIDRDDASRREATIGDEGDPGSPASERSTPDPHAGTGAWFDESALRHQGLVEDRVDRLRERFEALQMAELYLRDEATREGYLNRPRHRTELQELQAAAREELGGADYDWLLYAAGRNNRVLIEDVLADSPATRAGIEPGDLILRYDDVPVLSPPELNRITAQGEPGATVAVDVQRDGNVQRVYVRRGPLGAKVRWVRRAPLAEP